MPSDEGIICGLKRQNVPKNGETGMKFIICTVMKSGAANFAVHDDIKVTA